MSLAAKAKALAGGAVSFVARLIRAATHPFTTINEIRSAYRGMSMSEVSEVYWAGVAAYSSAQELLLNRRDLPSPADEVSTNPFLFGSDPQGNNYRYGMLGEYKLPGETSSRFVQFNVNSAGPLSLDELDDIFAQRWGGLNYDITRQFGGVPTKGITPIGTTILFAEKRN